MENLYTHLNSTIAMKRAVAFVKDAYDCVEKSDAEVLSEYAEEVELFLYGWWAAVHEVIGVAP